MSGRSCDVLVVGMGAAGCIAAVRLARSGKDVVMVGRESSATMLSTGRIDMSGVRNASELSSLLREVGADHSLYQGAERSVRAITNQGTFMRQTLSSEHDWTLADLIGRVAVMRVVGNSDLDPTFVCAAINGPREPKCRPYQIDLPIASSVPTGAGRSLGEEAKAVVDKLAPILQELEEETVVLPPIFVGPNSSPAADALERAAGRQIREAATPLSNPGRRLQRCLEDSAVKAGCTMWNGRSVRSVRFQGNRAVEVAVRSGLREQLIRPAAVLLATGNLVAGGLEVDGRKVVDPLGIFATASGVATGLRSPELGKALAAGLHHKDGRAVLKDGTVAGNVFVAGSAVPGISYPLGKGLGHVMADAWERAGQLEEML